MPSPDSFFGEEQNPLFRIFASHAIVSTVCRLRHTSLADPLYEWVACGAVCSGVSQGPQVAQVAQSVFDDGINNNTGLNSVLGFANDSFFADVQKELATGHFVYATDPCRTFLSCLSAGLFFASKLSNVSTGDLNKILNFALASVYSGIGCGISYNDFSNTELQYYFNKDWRQSVLEISASEKSQEVDVIGFSFLDVSDIFSSPVNNKLMKDSEIQYYQLSGKLTYDPVFWETLPYCEDIVIALTDVYGVVTGERILGPANTPCIDEENSYRPATGMIFDRTFCDGPYSSGIWIDTVKDALTDLDKAKIPFDVQYKMNLHRLTNFSGDYLGNGIGVDPKLFSVAVDSFFGEYKYPLSRERYNMPSSSDTNGNLVYQLNHMGFTGLKWGFVESGFGEFGEEVFALAYTGVTGFKYIPLELSRPLWAGKYNDVKYSPHIDSGRIFKLALNVHSGYILGEEARDSNGDGIAGRPQRGLYCDLPSFIFYQNFSSETFKQPAFVKMGCALTRTEVGPKGGYFQNAEESDVFMGGWSDTYYYDPIEAHQPQVKINTSVGSNFSTKESNDNPVFNSRGERVGFITEKTFGMGNSIDLGEFTGYIRNNAGYEYSGNLYNITGEFVSGNYFLWKKYCPNYVIGDGRKTVKYVKGFINNSGSNAGDISNTSVVYAYDEDRKRYTYEYFDNRITPSSFPRIVYPESTFCKKPVDETGAWKAVLGEQRTENFLPRYYRGPFATAHKKFLYPNAKKWEQLFFTPSVGFGQRIKINVSVEEYAVKEFFSGAQYNGAGLLGQTEYNYDPIGFKKKNFFKKTNRVDSQYSEIDAEADSEGRPNRLFSSGRNPLIYNSSPNFIQGFQNNRNLIEQGAYAVSWNNVFNTGNNCSGSANAFDTPTTSIPVGTYSKYTGYGFELTGIYVRPGWGLFDSSFHPEFSYSAFPMMSTVCENPAYPPGADPIYLLPVAGNQDEEGGYHKFNLIGDQWIGLYAANLGIFSGGVGSLGQSLPPARVPYEDDRAFIAALASSGLDIHFRALKFFPNTGQQGVSELIEGSFSSGEHIDISDFALGETYEFLSKEKRGQLFDIPSGSDWVSKEDCYGNRDWPTITGFWSKRSGTISGWREQSKLVITLSPVEFYDYIGLPFDTEHLCVPTGSCLIDGEFKYAEQGESAIYSDGCIVRDITNDPSSTIYTQDYASEVIKRGEIAIDVPINRSLQQFPSKMISRRNISGFKNPDFVFEKYYSPDNYNKYVIPALSNFALLNGDVSYEATPDDDGFVFPNATILTSASRGQKLSDGTTNPNFRKRYAIEKQNQFYDTIMGDAIYNSGKLVTSKRPISEFQEEDSFYLVPRGTTILDIKSGIF